MKYKYIGTEEQLIELGFYLFNGFYFRDSNLMVTRNSLIVGVGFNLSDEDFYTPKQARDIVEKGLVEIV